MEESKLRNAIWYLKNKKTKKFVCEYLGIPYNSSKLDKLLKDFVDSQTKRKLLRDKVKKEGLTKLDKEQIARAYATGESQAALAERFFTTTTRIKQALVEHQVPIRSRSTTKVDHIQQDLEQKLKVGSKAFYTKENAFVYITEVFDEEYIKMLQSGKQVKINTYPWSKNSRHSRPIEGIHFEWYTELRDKTKWKSNSLKQHISRIEDYIINTGRETYGVWINTDYSFKKLYIPRIELYPVGDK